MLYVVVVVLRMYTGIFCCYACVLFKHHLITMRLLNLKVMYFTVQYLKAHILNNSDIADQLEEAFYRAVKHVSKFVYILIQCTNWN